MHLNQLEVKNFRNYSQINLNFSTYVNIIFGRNAQGKTNLLEAIALLCLGKPIRTKREADLLKWGSEYCFLRGRFSEAEEQTQIEIGIGIKEKRIKVNGQIVKNNAIFGQIPVIIFSPDDLQLIKGAPQNRRDFIDLYMAQINPKYRYVYYDFYKVLQQRNRLLRCGFKGQDELETWDEQLIEKGSKVIKYRLSLIKAVRDCVIDVHHAISGAKEVLHLDYLSFNNKILNTNDEEEIKAKYREELQRYRKYEVERGLTLVGPHRDDLRLSFDQQIELKNFGSQGQQRTAALSLKLGLAEKIKEARGIYPLILLDDVMSEFDDLRKQYLLQLLISSAQTFLTSASMKDFPIKDQSALIFLVDQGEIRNVQ